MMPLKKNQKLIINLKMQKKIIDALIDRLDYDLYGLTEEEIKVVEDE